MAYWSAVFTPGAWRATLRAAAQEVVLPRPSPRWASTLEYVRQTDCLVCYVTHSAVWAGVLEISEPPRVADDLLRVRTVPIAAVDLDEAISTDDARDML